ncbi:DUF5615 family PIN-like protein [Candidatus Chloroploca sp. M-50]|uniref:DUF5615 family PIN-like protein n=1 Tax=Candidatus Chloroploca mongolica TaxID=2528176 RepID=A0ABS4DHG8_9CHLR|nr:DUF5615 family PIN-like protein [Candidatus Chloroploca mongolica]
MTLLAFATGYSRVEINQGHHAMLCLAADEHFNTNIVRGLLRRAPSLDIVRVQDAGLSGGDDPPVLAWAAQEGRGLLKASAAPREAAVTHWRGRRQSG